MRKYRGARLIAQLGFFLAVSTGACAAPEPATPLLPPTISSFLGLSPKQQREVFDLAERQRARAAVRQARAEALRARIRAETDRPRQEASELERLARGLEHLRREGLSDREELAGRLGALLTTAQQGRLQQLVQARAEPELIRRAACEGFIVDPDLALDADAKCAPPAATPPPPRRVDDAGRM